MYTVYIQGLGKDKSLRELPTKFKTASSVTALIHMTHTKNSHLPKAYKDKIYMGVGVEIEGGETKGLMFTFEQMGNVNYGMMKLIERLGQ